jgi:hypothetical protein
MTDWPMQELRAELFGEEGPKPDLLLDLASVLPESLLPQAIKLARAILDPSLRARVLQALAARLPETDRKRLLDDARTAAQAISDDRDRARALMDLAPHVPAPQRDSVLAEAHGAAKEIDWPWVRADVMGELAPLVLEVERPSVLAEALRAARNIKLRDLQASPLLKLAPLVSEAERSSVLAEALDAARKDETIWAGVGRLAELAQHLPQQDQHDVLAELLAIVRKIEDGHCQARALIDLAPHLPGPLLREALTAGEAMESEWYRAAALVGLAPCLTEPLLHEAVAAAREIGDPEPRARALAAQALYLPPSLQRHVLREALAAVQAIETEESRAVALTGLAPSLPEPLLSEARAAAEAIKGKRTQAKALAALTHLSMPARDDEPRKALATAREIGEEYWRAQALRALVRQLSEPLKGEALSDAHELTYKISSEAYQEAVRAGLPPLKAGETVAEQLARLSESEQDALMKEGLRRIPTRVVNTGFAPRSQAHMPLDPTMPLEVSQPYYFWLEVGQPLLHSIEETPMPLPEHVPSGAQLKVALFAFKDEIQITPGSDVGELQLQPDGTARVVSGPARPPGYLADRRLFFPVSAPKRAGTFRLRCNIYYGQILVQSRLIHARVMRRPQPIKGKAIRSVVDYTLSHRLQPEHLTRLAPHRLSLMLNSDGDGTHVLIFGEKGEFKNEATLSPTELKQLIENARQALWKVSWGDEDPWVGPPTQEYHYKDKRYDPNRLREDLINLAIRGYILYNAIIDKLTGGRKKSGELAALMLKPGLVQIALKQSPSHVLSAALFYDYPLNTQADHKLCEAFVAALQGNVPLEKTPCFNGACPRHGQLNYVCPSGFWGYRHSVGLPVSVASGTDVPPEIAVQDYLQMVVGVATNLAQLDDHLPKLQELVPPPGWHYSNNRDKILEKLKETKSHLIYFYCHGGVKKNVPYLEVGRETYIDGSNLRAYDIDWDSPRPLVFLNGCRTTALDPEQAFSLVQDFINTGGAGVIGTEITIFEPLACDFAEECLRRFLAGGVLIGEAVRGARLKLLKEGNPLGLVYIPFVLPSLRLMEQPATRSHHQTHREQAEL